ncbi:glycosyltransferase family 4 protein [Crenothrix sp.]|uniref:glycosyltransferase family 4 protein n=1 Tax=Crenothrix sp. TaxID=3100433 RepID=UPI00374CAF44
MINKFLNTSKNNVSKPILVIANTSWYLFNFRLNLMLNLKSLGYDIIAVAPPDHYSERLAAHGIRYVPMPMDNKGTHPIKDSILIFQLTKLFFKLKPSCILSYTPKCNIYGALAAGLLNIPIINNVSGLGTAFITENLVTRIVKGLYKISLKKSAKIFFQNKDDLALFINMGLVKAELTDLLPGSGVDVNRFTPVEDSFQHSTFVFLLVARMLKDKGIVEFIDATRLLKKQYPHIECQLLGFLDAKNSSAISSEEMRAWVNEGVVKYLGASDSVIDFLRQADCVVLPSYREGTPRSLLEAASVAKPIITTNAVGCREVVDDGVNGFLCKPRSVIDLKAKMEKMVLLPVAERLEMGLNGRKKVLNQFNEQIVIDRYINTIENIYNVQTPYRARPFLNRSKRRGERRNQNITVAVENRRKADRRENSPNLSQ